MMRLLEFLLLIPQDKAVQLSTVVELFVPFQINRRKCTTNTELCEEFWTTPRGGLEMEFVYSCKYFSFLPLGPYFFWYSLT